jgi:hypothetical protein
MSGPDAAGPDALSLSPGDLSTVLTLALWLPQGHAPLCRPVWRQAQYNPFLLLALPLKPVWKAQQRLRVACALWLTPRRTVRQNKSVGATRLALWPLHRQAAHP